MYTQPRVVGMVFLGFSAGLPFLLVFSTLSAWLRDDGAQLSVIGFFSWVGVIYAVKVFWAPVVDRLPIPFLTRRLGKRRSWMLIAQLGIAVGLLGLACSDVQTQLQQIALLAVWVAFCSSTQDIVVDAYRIEAAVVEYQGAMAAMYVFGYRVALLVAGAGAFYIADFSGWAMAYLAMALAMLVGIFTTLTIQEPHRGVGQQPRQQGEALEHLPAAIAGGKRALSPCLAWFADAVLGPFTEFFRRNKALSFLILAIIASYKMSDITLGVMANPFYLDLGFSKKEIADVTKVFGFLMTIAGASLGGVLVLRYGVGRPLLLGAIMVAVTNLLFALLAVSEPSLLLLAGVVSADNLSGGLAASVFIAYLSSLTNTAHTATQYALFSSLMTLPAKLLGGFSGVVVEHVGYSLFFVYASVVGLPAVVLVFFLLKVGGLQERGVVRPTGRNPV